MLIYETSSSLYSIYIFFILLFPLADPCVNIWPMLKVFGQRKSSAFGQWPETDGEARLVPWGTQIRFPRRSHVTAVCLWSKYWETQTLTSSSAQKQPGPCSLGSRKGVPTAPQDLVCSKCPHSQKICRHGMTWVRQEASTGGVEGLQEGLFPFMPATPSAPATVLGA